MLISTGMSDIDPDTEAFTLALQNGFVVIERDRAQDARRTLGCLYGLTADGNNTFPKVPSAVTVASIVQDLPSAVPIFLLLLGIRNLLKLK
jgi:hypothetical protein